MIMLSRAQIGKFKGNDGMDITIKSAQGWHKALAPTWDMVIKHKKGELTDKEYTDLYEEILDENIPRLVGRIIYRAACAGNHLTFLCYCKDGKFCHTYILIKYLCSRFPAMFTLNGEM